MFRMWGKLVKNNRTIQDTVAEIPYGSLTRTQMVFQALDEICVRLDLGKPIWLDANIREFQLRDRTHFGQDQFIETIDFDFLEIQIIEE